MIAYEEEKGKISLEEGEPPLELLVTHRSGYSDQWERAISDNPEKCFSREDMYEMARVNKWKKSDFEYSNFGSALAGTMVAKVYGKEKGLEDTSYQNAMNHFIQNELNLEHTKVGGIGDFADNWIWNDHDEMLGDGAITSNLTDVLEYGKRYLEKDASYAYLKRAIKGRASVDDDYDIGMFWIIGKENGFIWHNGEISMEGEDGEEVGYQCFIGISPEKNKVVVVLSNGICNDKSETAYTDILGYLLLSA